MISQAILVTALMLLATGRYSKTLAIPTCPTSCGDLAIPSSFGASSVCNLDFSFLGSYNHPSGYDSRSQANNSISGATFSEFSMSRARNFDSHGLEKNSEKWNGFPIPVNDVLEWPVANLSCHGVQKSASNFECRAINSEYVSVADSSPRSGYRRRGSVRYKDDLSRIDGEIDGYVSHSISNNSSPRSGYRRRGSVRYMDDLSRIDGEIDGYVSHSISNNSSPRSGYRRRGSVRYKDDLSRIDGEIDGYVSHSLSLTSYYGLYCICLVFTVPAFVISWIISFSKKKKAVKLRRDLFVRNGGKILEARQSVQKTLSVFTAEDLKKATNNYDEGNVLCEEDHLGITYKGILRGVNSGVTIHRCYAFDRCKIEILISKLVALSQISHTNVVKLLGCSLETQVPLVVYEFITSKTLLDYINDNSLSWDIRLKVAADTAGALAYLHSATRVPIIHGSLNSSCILLDHGYTVKVSGFALTCSECACVQFHGDTSIYLDPDCFSYGQLTEKGDVYSFGFILAELLTGKGVMSPEWLQIEEQLAEFFAGSSGGGDLLGILDDRLVTGNNLGRLAQVAEIAKRCLSSSSQERPTMKEVAISLEGVLIS